MLTELILAPTVAPWEAAVMTSLSGAVAQLPAARAAVVAALVSSCLANKGQAHCSQGWQCFRPACQQAVGTEAKG